MPAAPRVKADAPTLAFASRQAWETWLAKNHAKSDGIWLKMAKKASGIPTVDYPQALEVALCYGWIDGTKRAFDSEYFLQKFTPRRSRSRWSKINCDAAERLIASGAMKPAGLSEVERAKADGRWDAAYASPRAAAVPPDLERALAKNAKARRFFETLDSRNRYAILYRIAAAKRPATRARRIAQFVAMLAAGQKIY